MHTDNVYKLMYVEELVYILNNKDYIYSSTAEAVAHQNLRNIPRLVRLSVVAEMLHPKDIASIYVKCCITFWTIEF